MEGVDVLAELAPDQGELGEGGVEDRPADRGVGAEDEAEDGDKEEQEREDGDKARVGDVRDEKAGIVVARLLQHAVGDS